MRLNISLVGFFIISTCLAPYATAEGAAGREVTVTEVRGAVEYSKGGDEVWLTSIASGFSVA